MLQPLFWHYLCFADIPAALKKQCDRARPEIRAGDRLIAENHHLSRLRDLADHLREFLRILLAVGIDDADDALCRIRHELRVTLGEGRKRRLSAACFSADNKLTAIVALEQRPDAEHRAFAPDRRPPRLRYIRSSSRTP